MSYTCEDCKDRGWVTYPDGGNGRAERCRTCFTLEVRLRAAGVGADLLGASWDTWRGERPDISPFLSPGERFDALSLAERVHRVSCVTFLGPTGNGKSHCSVAILRDWVLAGCRCRFVEVPDMLEGIKATFGTDHQDDGVLEGLKRYDLVVLDEAYANRSTPWADEAASRIIRGLMRNGRGLIVTTNLTKEELHQAEPRVLSRMAGGLMLAFDGTDRRRNPLPG